MEPETPEQAIGKGYKYLAIGLRFAGGIVVFVFAGLLLDRWLHTTPIFVVVGTLLGAVLGFLSVYRELVAEPDGRKVGRSEGKR
jgi:F0F1-type ATP synthase assembly protein I